MEKHFVSFCSPGTFVAEETTKPIAAWDVVAAVKMADEITERYGATPYGFYFTTRSRQENELDSCVTAESRMYYLGGEVVTFAQLEARNDPTERILRDNMRINRWDKVLFNYNSWKSVHPLHDGDTVLEYTPPEREVTGS